MQQFDASAFLRAANTLTFYQTLIDTLEKPLLSDKRTDFVPGSVRRDLSSDLRKLRTDAALVGAKVTCRTIDECLPLFGKKDYLTFDDVESWVKSINSTLRREIGMSTVFAVSAEREKYLTSDAPLFGAEVSTSLPSAAFDVEEAGRCYGLGRPTACVFHNMRVLETCLRALAKFLALPDPVRGTDRNWGRMIQAIQGEAAARNANGGAGWVSPGDKEFVTDLVASLDAVRAAWRNTTMHVEAKYGDDEAEHIMVTVKALARKVAGRIDEEGNRTASS